MADVIQFPRKMERRPHPGDDVVAIARAFMEIGISHDNYWNQRFNDALDALGYKIVPKGGDHG
jgi:hypothetical protein